MAHAWKGIAVKVKNEKDVAVADTAKKGGICHTRACVARAAPGLGQPTPCPGMAAQQPQPTSCQLAPLLLESVDLRAAAPPLPPTLGDGTGTNDSELVGVSSTTLSLSSTAATGVLQEPGLPFWSAPAAAAAAGTAKWGTSTPEPPS